MFEKVKVNKLNFKAEDLPKQPIGEYILPCLTSSFRNQGLIYFVPKEGATILKNVISIPSNSDVYRAYFQSNEFTVLSDAYAIRWRYNNIELLPTQYLFAVLCINKVTDLPVYSYKNKLGGWNVVQNKYIKLPVKNGSIDYDFMDSFIAELEAERLAELEAYLSVAGLKDYNLTKEEQATLDSFKQGEIAFQDFKYKSIFNKIKQGRRLKKDDQQQGDIPFVMAGITNSGVVNYISNPIAIFPKNSTTVDIFGNAFYRNYSFGAGDDTGVYWNDRDNYTKETMLFMTTSIAKSLFGKFDFGNKLRSSQSLNFKMQLPVSGNYPDFTTMNTFISAIQKLVIKDVVLYLNKKMKH